MGAFKIRGAYNMLAQLPSEARAAGVVTYSSGNHGQAVALAAERLGMRAVIVMPETAPRVKVEGVRRYGGEVIFAGTTSVDRRVRAEAEAAARGLTIVPPFDHPWIIAGAGTCGLEILESGQDGTASTSRSGGGLVSASRRPSSEPPPCAHRGRARGAARMSHRARPGIREARETRDRRRRCPSSPGISPSRRPGLGATRQR